MLFYIRSLVIYREVVLAIQVSLAGVNESESESEFDFDS